MNADVKSADFATAERKREALPAAEKYSARQKLRGPRDRTKDVERRTRPGSSSEQRRRPFYTASSAASATLISQKFIKYVKCTVAY